MVRASFLIVSLRGATSSSNCSHHGAVGQRALFESLDGVKNRKYCLRVPFKGFLRRVLHQPNI